jgi:methylglutaconyl-CoA hydratase
MDTNISKNGSIETQILNQVAYITFSHPQGNSFPFKLLKALEIAIDQQNHNANVQCIVLKSEGTGVFCAGASFEELLEVTNLDSGKIFFSGFANIINTIRKCSKPIVGRVQGKSVGGGVGLIAACDYVMATEQSAIKLSEVAIGIGPFVIEPVISRKIGTSAMAALALAPLEWKSASWALDKGLFHSIFENIEQLDANVTLYAEQLASYHAEAIYELKKVLWHGTDHWDTLLSERAAISGKLVLSQFTKNALQEFKKQKNNA